MRMFPTFNTVLRTVANSSCPAMRSERITSSLATS
jgi:hypothetical protein